MQQMKGKQQYKEHQEHTTDHGRPGAHWVLLQMPQSAKNGKLCQQHHFKLNNASPILKHEQQTHLEDKARMKSFGSKRVFVCVCF